MLDSIVTLIWILVCIVAVLFLAYFCTKYIAKSGWMGRFSGDRSGNIIIMSQKAVGKDRQLLLVKAGERYFLLGSADSGITNLAEFTSEEAEKWRTDENRQAGDDPGFRQVLQTVLKQRNKR